MQGRQPGGQAAGMIFDVQKFCLHDGPGIRTTVFLKGCPLRCRWCGNPESQSPEPQLMTRDSRCVGCGACAAACPNGAIGINRQGRRIINWGACSQCLACVDACLYGALQVSGRRATVDEIVDQAERDRTFYETSGGGVTISGGEPAAQPEFAAALAAALRARGLHVALDTTGMAPAHAYELILPQVDLVLLDIKHLDPKAHQGHTGVANGRILENAARICAAVPTWLRMPLIAGFNADEGLVNEVAALGARLGARRLSLLPYHLGGQAKAEAIGGVYDCDGYAAPGAEEMEAMARTAGAHGLEVSIGS